MPFHPQPLSRVRKSDRAAYDRGSVFAVLDRGTVAHVGFVDAGRPIVIPMVYGRVDDRLYIHGARAARVVGALATNVPVCLTVTLLDGIVLARSAFHSSVNYRSVVVHGRADAVTDESGKEAALAAITDHLAPGRWDEVRPVTGKELRATGVLRVTIEAASAKARSGPPVDTTEDYDLPIWGGVVPVAQVYGEPADDGRLAPGATLPASVEALLSSAGDRAAD